MSVGTRVSLWIAIELMRLRGGLRSGWRRILVGAAVGWLLAVVLGATTLAALEVGGLISPEQSDELAIALALFGLGLGGLNAHALRGSEPQSPQRHSPQRG